MFELRTTGINYRQTQKVLSKKENQSLILVHLNFSYKISRLDSKKNSDDNKKLIYLGTGHYLSLGGGGGGGGSGGFGAKQGEILPISPLNVTSLKCCP